MNADDEIAACPFCAQHAAQVRKVDESNWTVVCGACGAATPVSADVAGALFLWEARAALVQNLGLLRSA